jgi:hypothetical protein
MDSAKTRLDVDEEDILSECPRGQRHNAPSRRWEVVKCSDGILVGTYLPEGVARRQARFGFYPDGTIVYIPYKDVRVEVYKKRVYLLDENDDVILDDNDKEKEYGN